MSSMRNAVQRRNHKERAQPLERGKWGLLEKHKDYSLRAKDHNEKKRRMKLLRQKVAERNPDEFAFGMMSATSKGGIKITNRGLENGTEGPLDMDIAKLLKTQDAGYLQTILQQTRNERERIEKDAIMISTGVHTSLEGNGVAKRTLFDEEGNEVQVDDDDSMDDDDDLDHLDGIDGEVEVKKPKDATSKELVKSRRKQRHTQEVLSKQLEILAKRERDLTRALDSLDSQRAKMHNTVGGSNKSGVKFKVRERKK